MTRVRIGMQRGYTADFFTLKIVFTLLLVMLIIVVFFVRFHLTYKSFISLSLFLKWDCSYLFFSFYILQ